MSMTLSDLRGLPHTSISQLKTYLQCPRKYRYHYIDRLEPQFRPIALAFGTAWHETVGVHLLPPVKDQWLSRQELQATFRDSLTGQVNEDGPPVLFEDQEDFGKTVDLGLRMLDAFILRVARPEQVLGVEVPFVLELAHPVTGEIAPVPLIGVSADSMPPEPGSGADDQPAPIALVHALRRDNPPTRGYLDAGPVRTSHFDDIPRWRGTSLSPAQKCITMTENATTAIPKSASTRKETSNGFGRSPRAPSRAFTRRTTSRITCTSRSARAR